MDIGAAEPSVHSEVRNKVALTSIAVIVNRPYAFLALQLPVR